MNQELFFIQDIHTGSVKGKFIWSDTSKNYNSLRLQKGKGILYLLFNCGDYTVINIFNMTSNSFNFSERNTSAFKSTYIPQHIFESNYLISEGNKHFLGNPNNNQKIILEFEVSEFSMIQPNSKFDYNIQKNPKNLPLKISKWAGRNNNMVLGNEKKEIILDKEETHNTSAQLEHSFYND